MDYNTKRDFFNFESSNIKKNLVFRLKQIYTYLDKGLCSETMFKQYQLSAKSEALYLITMLAVKYEISVFSAEVRYNEKAIEYIMTNKGGN